jgi:hypothetical protein
LIRGQRWDWDIPAMPGAVDEHGTAESSREELNLFFQLGDEVMAERGEQRPSKLKVAGSNPAGVATNYL